MSAENPPVPSVPEMPFSCELEFSLNDTYTINGEILIQLKRWDRKDPRFPHFSIAADIGISIIRVKKSEIDKPLDPRDNKEGTIGKKSIQLSPGDQILIGKRYAMRTKHDVVMGAQDSCILQLESTDTLKSVVKLPRNAETTGRPW